MASRSAAAGTTSGRDRALVEEAQVVERRQRQRIGDRDRRAPAGPGRAAGRGGGARTASGAARAGRAAGSAGGAAANGEAERRARSRGRRHPRAPPRRASTAGPRSVGLAATRAGMRVALAERVVRHLRVGGDDVRRQEDEQVGLHAARRRRAGRGSRAPARPSGTARRARRAARVSASSPPITTVWPSRAATTVLAERTVVVGPTSFGSPTPGRDRVDVGHLLEERQADVVVGDDLRRHAERDADVVALDRGEEVREVGARRSRGWRRTARCGRRRSRPPRCRS